jgi:hypothetical protein
VRGQKRSHWGQNGQNGNSINIHPDSTSNPATYQQHRERALSYDSQFLNQPQVLQTIPLAVLETSNSAPVANTSAQEPLAQEPNTLAPQADFLNNINTCNNSDQLSMIRSLGREQVHPWTTPKRKDEIAVLLNQIQVAEAVEAPIEGPAPKRAKDGTLIFEVLTMFASKDKQLPMTKGSFDAIMLAAGDYVDTLDVDPAPSWQWKSWSNSSGHLAVASNEMADLVVETINGLNGKVTGAGAPFRLWRACDLIERTLVKLDLKDSQKYEKKAEEILQMVFKLNKLKGGYTEATTDTDFKSKHFIRFKADPELKADLESRQTGSATFWLKYGGQQREGHMSRDPALVAREEAARVRARVEAALAKAIAESTRPLILAGSPVTAGGGPSAPVDQQQQLQQQQPQQQQQPSASHGSEVMSLVGYHAWSSTHNPQQQQSQQGNPNMNKLNLESNQTTSNLTGQDTTVTPQPEVTPTKGSVATRIRQLEDASSPPAGHDMAALSGGLPAEPSEAWGDAPTVTRQLRASPPTPPVAPPTNHMNATLNSSSFSYTSMDHSSEISNEIDDFLKQDDNVDEAMGDVDP